jgi:hypothetical protein
MPVLNPALLAGIRAAATKNRPYFLGAKTASFALTPSECYGGVFTNEGATGAIGATLPPAVPGMSIRGYLLAAQDVDFDPSGSERIQVLTNANGDALSSAATIGNHIELFCVEAGKWLSMISSGTWSDAN